MNNEELIVNNEKYKCFAFDVEADDLKSAQIKSHHGITLIALVITIIIMLILAGVVLSLTIGEQGIFKTAEGATKNYVEAQNKEMVDLNNIDNNITNIVDDLGIKENEEQDRETILFKENLVDFWPLISNLNNKVENRDNMKVTQGEVMFNDGLYIDGNTTVETINNYILPDGPFTISLQIKDITRADNNRISWILNIGELSTNSYNKNSFGFQYDNYYPNIIFGGSNGFEIRTPNGQGHLPTDGEWHTLTGIYDGQDILFYIDNKMIPDNKGNNATIKTDLSSKMGINRANSSLGKLDGYFKNLIIYNRDLTEEEINQINSNK